MENNIKMHFKKEDIVVLLDIEQPDLTKLVKAIISKHLEASKENIEIEDVNKEFDIDEFIEIIVSVHEEFQEEIDKFYKNIDEEIKTYYEDDDLASYIINELKKNEQY